jgi:16S rRNA (cytosine1402-N4)-methyltransferase
MTGQPHIPVMLNEVLAALAPADGETYIDGTFGAGGYTTGILDAARCVVLAIDQDKTALERGRALKDRFGDRLRLLHGNFENADSLARAAGFDAVDGFVLDLGVSSMQLDQAERGFSFRFDGPLDMRMDQSGGQTAADIVNGYDEEDLANIIYRYGDERHSRKVARAVVNARREQPFTTTLQLAELVRGVVPKSPKDKIDSATRTFQALRIAVNRELDVLMQALLAAENILRENGRLVVVSFHSLEDALVKQFLMDRTGRQSGGSRYLPESPDSKIDPTFAMASARAVFPTEDESRTNPRARSAKLRVAVRTAAPARGEFPGVKKGGRG